MNVEERVPLSKLTTFKSGGEATAVVHVTTEGELSAALAVCRERGLSYYPLGEGSNVLASDAGFEGMLLKIEIPGIEWKETADAVYVSAGAGVSWDALVREAAERGLWGIENLAGIPGTCGAAPVQNIGAYGAELSQVLFDVDVFDADKEELSTIPARECALAYRDSRFKHEPNLIILRTTLKLARTPNARIEYGDLLAAKERGEDLSTPAAIGAVVRRIRAGKFPDLAVSGTAGSFFKNPVLTPERYRALSKQYGEVPKFPNPHGVKVPLAFILDKVLSLRGFRMGNAHLFGAQPLVLVLDPGGTSAEIEALAQYVETRVYDATKIAIEREVRTLPPRAR